MSYIGAPRSNTAMFITKKIESKLEALYSVENCLVFAENGIEPSAELLRKHVFHFSDNPSLEYAHFARRFGEEREKEERRLKYIQHPEGYLVSESAEIGENAYIEPNCVIGHGVKIGKNAKILYGSVIRHSEIGDDFLCNEYAVIGSNGFTLTRDEKGNILRIPTLGRVVIGDYVEVGVHNNISCGSSGDTVLENYVKLDAMVHIGHDVHIHENTEIAAGTIFGGFAEVGEKVFMGINSTVRNRIQIGNECTVGMGAAVMKSVGDNITVGGYPARPLPTTPIK